ncbi:MAG TPA: 4Fe-4S dicluster domain-containing protein [Chlorobaculum parvum]|uniref:4Fe-4S dicluster domain-containing protein n=2 Tax=Chlorobaculum parvum TaxID=274539 RepID=A0A7C5HFN1_9CHLB|nr:4Fe-4S dicluster domain-containing protein [Chlorobaculum parvum]
MKRQIITIDETKCTGCGDCIPACPEGALQVIDGKARLVSDLFCDGLGACIGHCPTGAMRVETREAEPYDERRVMAESIVKAGPNVIAAHLRHLRDHVETGYLGEALDYLHEQGLVNPLEAEAANGRAHHGGDGCPGSRTMDFRNNGHAAPAASAPAESAPSALRQWPVQLHLVSPIAPYFRDADVLLAADCVAFAMGDFHSRLLSGSALAIACPKFDTRMERYIEKLVAMIDMAGIRSITVAIMEVPCCGGLVGFAMQALEKAGHTISVKRIVVGLAGEVLAEEVIAGEEVLC